MRHQRHPSTAAITGWALTGFLGGIVAGVVLSAWAGGVNRERLGRAARRARRGLGRVQATGVTLVREAHEALLRDPSLSTLGLSIVPVTPGTVELRGWVPSRTLRTRASRAVRTVLGVDHVVNSILVRGEDDRGLAPAAADQPA